MAVTVWIFINVHVLKRAGGLGQDGEVRPGTAPRALIGALFEGLLLVHFLFSSNRKWAINFIQERLLSEIHILIRTYKMVFKVGRKKRGYSVSLRPSTSFLISGAKDAPERFRTLCVNHYQRD